VALLLVLGGLQLRWLRQVAAADRQRLRAGVRSGLEALARDFDGEISRVWLAFAPVAPRSPDPEADLLRLWQRWRETAPDPDLVARLVLVPEEGGPQALDAASGRWAPYRGAVPEPAGLRRTAGQAGSEGRRPRSARFPFRLLRADLPGIQIPLRSPGLLADRGQAREGMIYVMLDRTALEERIRVLAARYLEPVLGAGASLRVADRRSGAVVYTTGPAHRRGGGFDGEIGLFGLLPPDELRRLAFAVAPSASEETDAGERREWPGWRGRERLAALASALEPSGEWVLAVRPAEGTLEGAVARASRAQAALAFGILLLVAAATFLLVTSARRAEETARRQLEFTAVVSHELRTPVTAIRSLAENLADGVVSEPAKARVYGQEIARQGARLGEMLERVLAVSALQARSEPRREEIRLEELVQEVAAEARAAYPEAALEVETDGAGASGAGTGPGILRGDREALRRALANLVTNALRHGGEPPWARIRLTVSAGGRTARIEVADRGPGIPAEEREQVFEAFYRGSAAREGQRAGTGLGLYLVRRIVERQGGTVELDPGAHQDEVRGARFVVALPLEAA
jgi:signal transduction histidine kinase